MKQNDIKNSIDTVKPDPYMKTRLSAKVMSAQPKSKTKKKAVAIVSATLCLALVITAVSIGMPSDKVTGTSSNTEVSSISCKVAMGGVIIAYAQEDNSTINEDLFSDSMVSKPILCKIGAYDVRNMSDAQQKEVIQKIKDDNSQIEKELDGQKVVLFMQTSSELFENAFIYQCHCGAFDFDIPTPENVKSITVSNDSEDGEIEIMSLDINYNDDGTLKDDGIDYTKSMYLTNYGIDSIQLSGERYAKDKMLDEKIGGQNFGISWKMAQPLMEKLNENPNMDLSTVKDTITFEVEFNDGSISKSVVDITFDSDGNMYATPKSFDYNNK